MPTQVPKINSSAIEGLQSARQEQQDAARRAERTKNVLARLQRINQGFTGFARALIRLSGDNYGEPYGIRQSYKGASVDQTWRDDPLQSSPAIVLDRAQLGNCEGFVVARVSTYTHDEHDWDGNVTSSTFAGHRIVLYDAIEDDPNARRGTVGLDGPQSVGKSIDGTKSFIGVPKDEFGLGEVWPIDVAGMRFSDDQLNAYERRPGQYFADRVKTAKLLVGALVDKTLNPLPEGMQLPDVLTQVPPTTVK